MRMKKFAAAAIVAAGILVPSGLLMAANGTAVQERIRLQDPATEQQVQVQAQACPDVENGIQTRERVRSQAESQDCTGTCTVDGAQDRVQDRTQQKLQDGTCDGTCDGTGTRTGGNGANGECPNL